jgi:hypothetical protein
MHVDEYVGCNLVDSNQKPTLNSLSASRFSWTGVYADLMLLPAPQEQAKTSLPRYPLRLSRH